MPHLSATTTGCVLAATDEFMTLLPLLARLPRHVDQIASSLEAGRLRVNLGMFAGNRDTETVYGIVDQVLLAFLGGTAGLMSALLLANPGGPAVTPTVTLYELFGYVLILLSAVLVLRVPLVILSRPR